MMYLDALFPGLAAGGYEIVSGSDTAYNCIAYAAGETHRRWDIEYNFHYYWPPHASRTPLIASLIEVFAGLGFEICPDAGVADGYEKVALYARDGEWTHAAIQMPSGRWRSKLGDGPLIEHPTPQSLASDLYGEVHCIMSRSQPTDA